MPTTYTHYRFGEDVYVRLPERIQKEILPYIEEYNIGVHGPDILFYYHAYRKNKVNQYGVHVHDEPMSAFLAHAMEVYAKQSDSKRAFAYLAGMMTHFYLDSTCHPYINRRIEETGISHTEIETELDAVLMKHDHYDPIRKKPAVHVIPNWESAKIIAPYFKQSTAHLYTSLVHMRFILNHVFRSPYGVKRNLVQLCNRWLLPAGSFEHYFVHTKRNWENRDTLKELIHIYAMDRDACAAEIVELRAALQARDEQYKDKEVFANTYSG